MQLDLFSEPSPDIRAIVQEHLALTRSIAQRDRLPTINSVSGGKTSAFMAAHYPAGFNLFACVLTDDPAQAPQDKGLLRACQRKLPQFQASLELDSTLRALLDLEQILGQEIIWIAGISFDRLIAQRQMLPNRRARFCTEELKILPIYRWIADRFSQPIEMRLGFRFDEESRIFRKLGLKPIAGGGWDISDLGDCEKLPKSKRRKLWRYNQFPLYSDRISHPQIRAWAERSGLKFPEISNCAHCPFHSPKEHRKQHQQNPHKAAWWIAQEKAIGKSFGDIPLEQILSGDPPSLPLWDAPCHCSD